MTAGRGAAAPRTVGHPAPTMTLGEYVLHRTGTPLGSAGSIRAMLAQSFGARSFATFWQHWNPVWGWALARFVHAPVRRSAPAAVAVLATFLVSGLLHDAAASLAVRAPTFVVTPWFLLLGVGALVSRATGMDISGRPGWWRATTHLTYVLGCLGVTLIARAALTG